MSILPLLESVDWERLGVSAIGDRIVLVQLSKAQSSKLINNHRAIICIECEGCWYSAVANSYLFSKLSVGNSSLCAG